MRNGTCWRFSWLLVLMFGCTDGDPSGARDAEAPDAEARADGGTDEPDGGAPDGSGSDVGGSMDGGAMAGDLGDPDGAVAPDADPPPDPDDVCHREGLPRDPFRTEGWGNGFVDVAGDFTVREVTGRVWNFEQNHSGCESYVFFLYLPNSSTTQSMWLSSVRDMLENESPLRNVHYFFVSDEADPMAREQRVDAMRVQVQSALFGLFDGALQVAEQLERFHFVTDRARDVEGSVGAFVRDYFDFAADQSNWVDLGDRGVAPPPPLVALGIDREQRWDAAGSPSEFVGGPRTFRLFGHLSGFFNHKARLRHQVESEQGVERFSLLDQVVTDRIFVVDAELPDSAAMEAFDTLEFDVEVTCRYRNVFACSEWDRIGRIELCLDGESCSERTELARWITPYWRRGSRRWIMDASPLLGLLQGGGRTWFRLVMGPSWERKTERDARFELRLSASGAAVRPVDAELLYTGGPWNASYNQERGGVMLFTPPASAQRVELVVIVSGHGQADGSRCAEWCDHRHLFRVNGNEPVRVISEPGIGSARGCGPAASQGASPGQWGNWAPQRAFWCPGLPVQARTFDITDQVQPGEQNQVEYESVFQDGGPPAGGNIDLSVYITYWE